MNVEQISQFACQTIGDTSSDMQNYAMDALRLKYQTLYDAHAWRESMRVIDIVLDPTLGGAFFIPLDAEEVVFLKFSRDALNYTRLNYRERDWIERVSFGNAFMPYSQPLFYRSENLAWPYLSPGKLTLQTSALTSFAVHIEGITTGGPRASDDFLLSATQNSSGLIIPSSVQTVNAYDKVTSFSKGFGALSVVADTPSTLTVQIPAEVSDLIYSQFVIYPNPIWTAADGKTLLPAYVQTQVKLKADVLGNAMSVPRISHIWDALIEYTLSALYTRTRQLAKADAREQKAIGHIQAAVNTEKNQSEFRQQVIPAAYESGDYLGWDNWRATSSHPWGY
jgi:hypothetical protein